MLNITDQMPDTINEGERVIRLLSRYNEDYVVTDLDGDELEEEIRLALRRRYGKNYRYEGFEDVTYALEAAERARGDAKAAWRGEGWYRIGWSDGGTYGEHYWYYDDGELAGDLESAYLESTETHLPYVEFLWDGSMPNHTAQLWDQGLSAFLDGMTPSQYALLTDESRDAIETLAEAWRSPDFNGLLESLPLFERR